MPSLKKLLTLGMAKEESDLEKLLGSIKCFRFHLLPGVDLKKSKKTAVSIFGKDFENVHKTLDGLVELYSIRSMEELFEALLNGRPADLWLSGEAAKKAEKLGSLDDQLRSGGFRIKQRGDSSYLLGASVERIVSHMGDYLAFSKDKKTKALLPEECSECQKELYPCGSAMNWDSEDSHAFIMNDGRCSNCGSCVVDDFEKKILKVYPLMRKFEIESGRKIFS
jgi:hypothetical protein